MTVNEAIEVLKRLAEKGEGELPLQIMGVEQGITVANDIEIERAKRHDGDRVWIYGVESHLPEWMLNAAAAKVGENAEITGRTLAQNEADGA